MLLIFLKAGQQTLIEDFLLANMDDDQQLARMMEMEKRLAEMQKNCLHINTVRCATHTLELAVKDTIDTKKMRQMPDACNIYIQTVRKAIDVVRKLRTTKMKIEMDLNELLMPVAFIDVRWNSVNTMVRSTIFVAT